MNHEFNQEIFMNKSFKLASLAGAIALAMGSTAAFATPPTSTQLPGQGKIVTGTVSAGTITSGEQTITIGDGAATSMNAVINWGSGADINKSGPAGFNIGSDAKLHFVSDGTVTSGAVLNIDSSGNASQIMGTLDDGSTAGTPATNPISIFVANSNGVIVGSKATIMSAGAVGLIANKIASDQTGFGGAAPAYNGTGGDVTVAKGASISGDTVLVSGGGTVNVDLGGITGASGVTLNAGVPAGGGAFANTNANAQLNLTGDFTATANDAIASAGAVSSTGTVDLSNATATNISVAGTFTNTGSLNLDGQTLAGTLDNENTVTSAGGNISVGALVNNGNFGSSTTSTGDLTTTAGGITNNGVMYTGAISTTKGGLTNNAQIDSGAITVAGGDLSNLGTVSMTGNIGVTSGSLDNQGTITSDGGTITATDGSITNAGKLDQFNTLTTTSNSADAGFTAGADYSITNTGSVISNAGLTVKANSYDATADAKNDSTGSFTNSGQLWIDNNAAANGLSATAHNDVMLGGTVQTTDNAATATVTPVSAKNPLGGSIDLTADTGTVTVATPLASSDSTPGFSNTAGDGAIALTGNMVKVMDDVTATAGGFVNVQAGGKTGAYAVRVAKSKTLASVGGSVSIQGMDAASHPNVILQGTVSGDDVNFGATKSVSDIFSGPVGGIVATGAAPTVEIGFTGAVKTAPYLNDSGNFRYNYLPISATSDATSALALTFDPTAYATNGTDNGMAAVNVLVNHAVKVTQDTVAASVAAGGTAVTGITNTPNTHFVLQSTGNVEFANTGAGFYWPGYVYVGTIAADANGNAMPGTLGFGTITTDGTFNNVMPGDVDGASGIHFMTQLPLALGGNVVTNANAWINFPTDALTNGYANGTINTKGFHFYGGSTSSTSAVVNYGPLAKAKFHTQAPNSSK